jgi:Ca2+-dependent lipid-binding protein
MADFLTHQPSRVAADFQVEVFDWDQVGTSESLGSANIDLADLEALEAKVLDLALVHTKYGKKGEIQIGMVFTPQIVARSRKATTTFAIGARTMTQVASVPFGATLGVARGFEHGASRFANLLGSKKNAVEASEPDPEGFSIPVPPLPTSNGSKALPSIAVPTNVDPPAGQVSQPVAVTEATVGAGAATGLFPTSNTAASMGAGLAPRESGILRVTVTSAKDLSQSNDIKPYVQLKIGKKEFSTKHLSKTLTPEWCDFCILCYPSPNADVVSSKERAI